MVIRVPRPRSTQAGSYAELDDRMLVLDFQAGQVEAFVEIHHRYAALTRHVCGRFLQNHQDVDEALQETWIRVFQGLHRFNGRYALQPWVSRIATNVSLDLLRARARRPQLDDQPIDEHEREDGSDGPEEEVEKLIQRDMVIAVLAGLPDTHRRVLVLRELEGRSHKEIGAELEMTPAQAKALIHRAKGTFRREWLRAATERHGLAGIFLIPILWFSKLGGVARRLADRVGEVAHVGGTEVLTQAAQAASTPIVPAAASGFGEKIVAAGLSLLVAGGVTIGAATIVRDRANRDKPEAVVAAPAEAPSPVPTPERASRDEDASEREDKVARNEDADRTGRDEQEAVPPVVETPVVETPVVTPTPEPSSSPSPTPEPTPSAAPTPPPAPAWSFTFTSSNESVESCGCDPVARLVSSTLQGEVGGDVTFTQTIEGAVLDAVSDPTWPFVLELSGAAGPSGGRIGYGFTLSSLAGLYSYEGSAVLSEAGGDAQEGSFFYRFYGTYQLQPGAEPVAGIPQRGFLAATIGIWSDGTIYLGSVALSEAS